MSAADINILVVDDEPNIRRVLEAAFMRDGYHVATADCGRKAVEYAGANSVTILVTDLILPDLSGVDVLKQLKQIHPQCVAIVVTAYGTIRSAVEATQAGAFDYIQKPFDLDEVRQLVKKAVDFGRAPSISSKSKRPRGGASQSSVMRCVSPAMQEVYDIVDRVADTGATVLIQGESGTGKELVARSLHTLSRRAEKPFVPISCAALSETLLESELFGHEKNAFTGAVSTRIGRFELANNGTLFLDEIGDITLHMQVKLLRVIQEMEFERVGGNRPIKVDVRLVAATNQRLDKAIEEGKFRSDLYYRLNIVEIVVPPLRDRKDDILPLADGFLQRYASRNNRKICSISPDVKKLLLKYTWPGNVRELENIIERTVVLADPNAVEVTPNLLPNSLRLA